MNKWVKKCALLASVLSVAACGGGGGGSSGAESANRAEDINQYSKALTATAVADNQSVDAGVWKGLIQSPAGAEYNLAVVVDELGGALIEITFINDEKSFELNALRLFGVPDYWGSVGAAAGFELERPLEKDYWKDVPEEITYAAGHVEVENGNLSVSVDISRGGDLYTMSGVATPEAAAPFSLWATVLDAAKVLFGDASYSATGSNFVFQQNDCVMTGTYLTGNANASVSRVSMRADCVSNYNQGFSGDYVGFAYRAAGACNGSSDVDVLRLTTINSNSALKLMPYAC